ncbi:hypothetical protein WA026_020581 [Henosepilachna vigintioctopunctata]|uniref:Uncharacterized protein n=1 Tax=Henosepilachna vigintioctopunctata TaxID=420089 RepID=A0AAW1V4M9_9CUCU
MFSYWTWFLIALAQIAICLIYTFMYSKEVSLSGFYYACWREVPVGIGDKYNYRFITAVYLLAFHVILVGVFNGTLYKSFSTLSFFSEINTLEDLEKSDLIIETSLNIFGASERESELFQKLSKKVKNNAYSEKPAIKRAAQHMNVAAMERREEAFFKINAGF